MIHHVFGAALHGAANYHHSKQTSKTSDMGSHFHDSAASYHADKFQKHITQLGVSAFKQWKPQKNVTPKKRVIKK
jgi:hypothetical protein